MTTEEMHAERRRKVRGKCSATSIRLADRLNGGRYTLQFPLSSDTMQTQEREQNKTASASQNRVKIVVCVDGGVVYGVYSNQPYDAVEVLLVDHDDMEAEGIGRDERDAVSDRETRHLMEHYIERPQCDVSQTAEIGGAQ
jgi:hypothetical protein